MNDAHDATAPRARRGRDSLAVTGARAVSAVARRTGHAGTSLPGMVAERMAPGILSRLAGDLGPTVMISGTNGKTTTTYLLAWILRRVGRPVVSNRSGANLRQGIASTLVAQAGPDGRLRSRGSAAVFEVDEATLPTVADALPIATLVLTNLFRDQLDRFGETDEIIRRWQRMLDALPAGAPLVSCSDDPRLAYLTRARSESLVGFGLIEPPLGMAETSLTPEVTTCPSCDGRLVYAWSAVGHLGAFACQACGFGRSEPDLGVRVVSSRGIDGQTLAFRRAGTPGEVSVAVRLPGTSNAYNAAAAVAAAITLDVPVETAVGALADTTSAFGRYEEVEIDGRRVVLMLGKNPASLGELTRVGAESAVSSILFALNDQYADGRDVSWYWDVDPTPMLAGRAYAISGSRAPDFRLRLKYQADGGPEAGLSGLVGTFADPPDGLAGLVEATPRGGTILVIATYTALLRLHRHLVGRGLAPHAPR